jgi:hypothetical protein
VVRHRRCFNVRVAGRTGHFNWIRAQRQTHVLMSNPHLQRLSLIRRLIRRLLRRKGHLCRWRHIFNETLSFHDTCVSEALTSCDSLRLLRRVS